MVTIMIGYLDAYKCYRVLCDRHSLGHQMKEKKSELKHIFIAFFSPLVRALEMVAAYLNCACAHLPYKNEIQNYARLHSRVIELIARHSASTITANDSPSASFLTTCFRFKFFESPQNKIFYYFPCRQANKHCHRSKDTRAVFSKRDEIKAETHGIVATLAISYGCRRCVPFTLHASVPFELTDRADRMAAWFFFTFRF